MQDIRAVLKWYNKGDILLIFGLVEKKRKKEKEQNPNFRARRWDVEVTHSFFNRFRKLLVRFEKKAANYLALIQFACAIIVWRKCILVHKS